MTTAVQERAVFCNMCSAPTGDYTTTGETSVVGKCCENLANPYRANRDGQYVRPNGMRTAHIDDDSYGEDEENEDARYWECPYCECQEILVDASQPMYYQVTVNTTDYDPGQDEFEVDVTRDSSPGYGDIEITDVACASCGRSAQGIGVSLG